MREMNRKFWLLLCSVCISCVMGGEFKLTENGRAHCRIQSNPTATGMEYRAVCELQRYLKKISGADARRNTSPGNVWRVFRGEDPDIVQLTPVVLENARKLLPVKVVQRLDQSKSPEAYYIFSEASAQRGKSIFIAGRSPAAVLYGTNAFIEDYLGVRFFHAGPEGEYCPRNRTIVLKDIDDFREPWLQVRRMSCWTGSVKPWPMQDMEEWLTRRCFHWNINHNYNNLSLDRLNHAMTGNHSGAGGGHLTYELSIPQSLFKTHPEFFPLQKGKRVCKDRSQRCFSNPEVRKRIVDYICWHTDYQPSFRINFHDSTDGWCECPDCIRYGTDKNGKYSLSNVAFRLVCEVAEAVLKYNPKADLSCLSYSDYRELPTIDLKFPPELTCVFCPHQRCYVHPFNDPHSECNQYLFNLFNQWRRKCPKIGIFDYYAYSQSPYCPMEYTLAKDMKYYRQIGLHTWIEDCTNKELPIPASNWQFYYLASKLAWNADLDAEKLLDETYSLYYGPAAVPMKKYHALRRSLWESVPGHALYGGGKRYGLCLLVPGAEKRLTGYLAEADRLAKADAVVKSRIAIDRGFLAKYWIAEAAKIRKTMGAANNIPVSVRTSPVKIDGVLDEEAWRRAQLVTPFLTMKGKNEPIEETRVKVLYDDQAWYVGIEAMTEHAWGKLLAEVKERDGQVWRDDSVEIFLAPPSSEYYQLVINSLGTLYDSKLRNHLFNMGAEVKTKVLKDRYVVEVRIPVKNLGRDRIRAGEGWQFHFCRGCKNLQPPKALEYSTIAGIPPHAQEMFLRAATGQSVVRNGDFAKVKKVTAEQKKRIFSDEFPDGWGASNAKMTVNKGRNCIALKDVIWGYLNLPQKGTATKISGEIIASGKGKILVTLSGCIRPKGDKRSFGHEIKRQLAEFELTEETSSHPLEFQTEPDARYFLYVRVKGGRRDSEALIQRISLNR